MTDSQGYVPSGVIPATLLAFDQDMSINWAETVRHLTHVAAIEGISAITVNGHASEVHACSFDEQRAVLERSLDTLGDKLPVIAGVYADGSLQAARIAKMSQQAGASALLVFPSNTFMMGGHLRPEMAVTHFRSVADASDLPIICFNYARWTNNHYPLETLLKLFEAVPTIRAIKDWTAEPMEHERNIQVLQSLPRPVNVLTTNSAWLMASLTQGCNGLLSGAGSIIADLQVALFRAVQDKDLALAQAVNERIRPVAHAFYAQPFLDMHNRMKEAAVLLGRQDRAVVRPPLVKLSRSEIEGIRQALAAARIEHDGAVDLNSDLRPGRAA